MSSGSGDIRRSLELMWHGREDPARGPRPGLTLERIVTAAVALADREGIDALSMRKVAAELGVGTMSLYRYVPGKAELVDLMLDHVDRMGPPPAADGWRARLADAAGGIYRLYLRHPWLLQVNRSRSLLGPNALAGFEYLLATLDGLGLTDRERVAVIVSIDSFVTGLARQNVLLEQIKAETDMTDEEFWGAQGPILADVFASGRFPQVTALDHGAFETSYDELLAFGLERLLDGVEAFVSRRRPAAAGG
jgi:AcrR family transcriptional regulator